MRERERGGLKLKLPDGRQTDRHVHCAVTAVQCVRQWSKELQVVKRTAMMIAARTGEQATVDRAEWSNCLWNTDDSLARSPILQ